jgi:hypothetical protein
MLLLYASHLEEHSKHLKERYLNDQLKTGVITPSKSSWANPVALVRKKDQSVRWCIDYRKVNELTVKDAYPSPTY